MIIYLKGIEEYDGLEEMIFRKSYTKHLQEFINATMINPKENIWRVSLMTIYFKPTHHNGSKQVQEVKKNRNYMNSKIVGIKRFKGRGFEKKTQVDYR